MTSFVRVPLESLQTVAGLEAEIVQIDQLTERLAKRRSDLLRRINSLAHISRLPPEVLVEIFSFASRPSTTDSTCTPLFLGSICADWRRLAWNTPSLWTRITLTVSKSRSIPMLHLLPEWLARATTLPLHIALSTTEEDDSTFRSLRNILEVLVERSDHWGSFQCSFPPQCHDLLSFRRFPMLTRVVLRPPLGSISTFNKLPDVFGGGGAPGLCDVDISGFDYPSVSLPWDQLKRFKAQFLTVAECYELLKRCPQLKSCVLGDVYCPNRQHTSLQLQAEKGQVAHHNLEVLDVTFLKSIAMPSLLGGLHLPSLKELGVHFPGIERISLQPVVSLALRSALTGGLRKLSVSRNMFEEDDLVRCLESLIGLEELDLKIRQTMSSGLFGTLEQGMTESFVRRFMPVPSSIRVDGEVSSVLLPRLKRLHFTGKSISSVGTVLELLAWRCMNPSDVMGVAKLENARFTLTGLSPFSSIYTDIVVELEELRGAGLDVVIAVDA